MDLNTLALVAGPRREPKGWAHTSQILEIFADSAQQRDSLWLWDYCSYAWAVGKERDREKNSSPWRRKYMRGWELENRDRRLAYKAKYRAKNRARLAEIERLRRAKGSSALAK